MAQAGIVWVPVVPSMRGFVTKVETETKKIPSAKVRLVPEIDFGEAATQLGEFRALAEKEIGRLHSAIDLDTGSGTTQLGRWVAEAYAVAGQIASNVNVDTNEAAGRVAEFRAAAESELGDLTTNVDLDDGAARAEVETFHAWAVDSLGTVTAQVDLDDGAARAEVETFRARADEALNNIPAQVDLDDGAAIAEIDAFRARADEKLSNITAEVDLDDGAAIAEVDEFRARADEKLANITAEVDLDDGAANAEVDAFRARADEKLDPITANVDADTGGATEKVDAFRARESGKPITANVDADTGAADAKVDDFRSRGDYKLHDMTANVDLDDRAALDRIDFFNTTGRMKLNKPSLSANVDADTGKANGKVDSFAARARGKLHDITANINADTGRATARIHVWKAEMNRYVNNPITAFPVVNTSIATAQLVAWKGFAQGLVGTIQSTVTLDFGGVISGVGQMVSSIFEAYLGVLSFAEAWGAAFVAVAGVIALVGSLGPLVFALIGGLALIPALAVTAGFAIGTLLIGFNGVGAAITAAFDPTKVGEFQAALEKLSPEAKKTMLALQALGKEFNFTAIQNKVQDALFRDTAPLLKAIGEAYIPIATRGFIGMAAGINDAVKAFGGFLLMPQVLGRLAEAQENITNGFKVFAGGAELWGEGLTTLAAIGSRQVPRIAEGFANAGREFSAFIDRVAGTGELDAFLTRSVDELGVLLHLFGNLGQIVWRVFEAAGTSGVDLVRMLDDATTALVDFLNTGEGFDRLVGLFEASYQTMRNIRPLFEAIGAALAGPVWDTFIEFAPSFGQAFGDLAGIIPGLAVGFHEVTAAADSVMQATTPLLYALVYGLGPAVLSLIGLIASLANLISGALTAAIWALQGPLAVVSALFQGVTGWANSLGFSGGGVAAFATGGVVPGYQPGKDTVPVVLSRGEGVLVPEAVRGLGPEFVGWANRHYSRGRSDGGSGLGTAFAGGSTGVLLKQTIQPGQGSAAAVAPSLAGIQRGGIGTASPGDFGDGSTKRGGVTQVNHFNVPLDEQAYSAATLRRLDFAQRMAG